MNIIKNPDDHMMDFKIDTLIQLSVPQGKFLHFHYKSRPCIQTPFKITRPIGFYPISDKSLYHIQISTNSNHFFRKFDEYIQLKVLQKWNEIIPHDIDLSKHEFSKRMDPVLKNQSISAFFHNHPKRFNKVDSTIFIDKQKQEKEIVLDRTLYDKSNRGRVLLSPLGLLIHPNKIKVIWSIVQIDFKTNPDVCLFQDRNENEYCDINDDDDDIETEIIFNKKNMRDKIASLIKEHSVDDFVLDDDMPNVAKEPSISHIQNLFRVKE